MVENPQASLLPAQRISFWHLSPSQPLEIFRTLRWKEQTPLTLGLSNLPLPVKHFLLLLVP